MHIDPPVPRFHQSCRPCGTVGLGGGRGRTFVDRGINSLGPHQTASGAIVGICEDEPLFRALCTELDAIGARAIRPVVAPLVEEPAEDEGVGAAERPGAAEAAETEETES